APVADALTTVTYDIPNPLHVGSGYTPSALANCRLTKVHGDVTLDLAAGVESVSLTGLKEIAGDLTITQAAGGHANVSLAALTRVRGSVSIAGMDLTKVSLPGLETIEGSLSLIGNTGTFFSLAQLTTVGKSLIVGTGEAADANSALVSFSLANLSTVGG